MTIRPHLALFGIAACIAGSSFALEAAAASPNPKPEIVERDSRGRATAVQIDGTVYKVCSAQITDGCINPRQAGLNFGNRPMETWPGKSVSEKRRSKK